jgi:hypothetical protein
LAKSKIIRQYKNKIMSELSQDDDIIKGLGLNDDESEDDLIWVRLMPHHYVPNTQESVKTYITVENVITPVRSDFNLVIVPPYQDRR